MPFYFQKSVKAGPFRFNFSKGGVGASVGIKGFRIGTGPRGHYVHASAAGVQYRSTLRRAGEKATTRTVPSGGVPRTYSNGGVQMVEVESGSVLAMQDEGFDDVIAEINASQARLPWGPILGLGLGCLGVALFFVNGALGLGIMALAVLGLVVGSRMDSYRRAVVLFYDLDDASPFEVVTLAFDELMGCSGKWHVAAGGAVRDLTTWKRNAGASHIVDKKPATLAYGLPSVLKSNVVPPYMRVGRQIVYLLPDVALVRDGNKFGAVTYQQLKAVWQTSNFIEEGRVPGDATVIGNTWKHPNKSGGPDRRFSNNYQIPICRYEALHLSSGTGLNELLEFSKSGVCGQFVSALQGLARTRGVRQPTISKR